jgi:hypothetical protein
MLRAMAALDREGEGAMPGKRELLEPQEGRQARQSRRDHQCRFDEVEDVARSLS